jgi:ribonuclease Z
MKTKITIIAAALFLTLAFFGVYLKGHYDGSTGKKPSIVATAEAKKPEAKPAPQFSPVKPLPAHDAYYPGTEALGPDEMRVVALGTGMPTVRPKQAAACFLVDLGNGDKFLFDIGYGSVERLSAMKIPMDYLDKVFIGHLHMDHFGDLDALWIGGVKMNRTFPLRVWGAERRHSRDGHELRHRRSAANAQLGRGDLEGPPGHSWRADRGD